MLAFLLFFNFNYKYLVKKLLYNFLFINKKNGNKLFKFKKIFLFNVIDI